MTLEKIPFIAGPPVSGKYFIDRTNSINNILALLESSQGNILLFGKRRVGKTSLCLKLLEESQSIPKTIVAYMSMEANYDQTPEQFTQAAILHIISKISAKLFSKKYSDLLMDLGKPKLSKDYKRLLRIFELVRSADRTVGYSRKANLGASAIVTAQVDESESTDVSVGSLSSFELMALLDEVVEFLHEKGIYKFVLIVDEANKFTLSANARIIRENFSLFSARGLQFCFVTTPEIIASVAEADELFQEKCEVGPFEDKYTVEMLVENYRILRGLQVKFSPEAIDAIWKVSRGFPYTIQFLCNKCFIKALEENTATVSISQVLDVVSEHNLEI
jgi:AAA+ ATPase superfamily predicted ATPase